MKRAAIIAVAVLGILLLAALVIPFFIPTEVYKTRIQQAAKEATGRELILGGNVSLSLLPPVRLKVENVAFANAEWASTGHMAEMKSLSIGIDPFAYLFGGKVVVTEFVLRDPVIHLETARDGRANWELDLPAPEPEEEAETAADAGGVALKDLMLGDVRLVNGLVTYKDGETGETLGAENINATVSLPSLDGPLKADGGLRYNDQDIRLDLRLEKPRAFLDGESSALDLALKSALVRLTFDGAMAGNFDGEGLPAQGAGALEFDVPSMRKLAAWFGEELPAGKGYGPLNVKGKATASGNKVAIDGASLRVDEMSGKGAFALDLGGARPAVTGVLDMNRLDVTPYQGTTAVGKAEQATGGAATGSRPAEGWSTEPIDFSALKSADADLKLTAAEIDTGTLKTGKAQVTVNLVNGLFKADLRELGLYEGGGTASFEIDARNDVPVIRNRMNFDAVKALPLFRDLTGMGVLEGVGNFKLDVTSRGRSQREIVQALNGTGSLHLTDGALYGINLAEMVRKVDGAIGSFLGKDGVNPLQAANMIEALSQINTVVADLRAGDRNPQKTDFTEFGGTFRFENGTFRNDDLLLQSPLLRANGAGLSDLVQRTVDYTVTPRLVGTLKGQGDESRLKGIAIPIRVSGTWDKLAYSLDSRALVQTLLGESGGPLGGILGGEGGKPDAGKLLEGVLGKKDGAASGGEEPAAGDDTRPGGVLDSLTGRKKEPAKGEAAEGATSEQEKQEAAKPKPGDRLRGLLGAPKPAAESEAASEEEVAPAAGKEEEAADEEGSNEAKPDEEGSNEAKPDEEGSNEAKPDEEDPDEEEPGEEEPGGSDGSGGL